MCDFLKQDGLSVDILTSLSYRSQLGISLKNSLRHFQKTTLMEEVERVIEWYDESEVLSSLPLDYRIKSLQSASSKYDRYFPDRQLSKVFDDLLGFRALRDTYSDIVIPAGHRYLRIADMSKGKANDDGYRGVHVYFRVDNFCYPIEIQYNTYIDRQLNNWLHKFIYKKNYPIWVGSNMRERFEAGEIRNEFEFEEVLLDVLRRGEKRE